MTKQDYLNKLKTSYLSLVKDFIEKAEGPNSKQKSYYDNKKVSYENLNGDFAKTLKEIYEQSTDLFQEVIEDFYFESGDKEYHLELNKAIDKIFYKNKQEQDYRALNPYLYFLNLENVFKDYLGYIEQGHFDILLYLKSVLKDNSKDYAQENKKYHSITQISSKIIENKKKNKTIKLTLKKEEIDNIIIDKKYNPQLYILNSKNVKIDLIVPSLASIEEEKFKRLLDCSDEPTKLEYLKTVFSGRVLCANISDEEDDYNNDVWSLSAIFSVSLNSDTKILKMFVDFCKTHNIDYKKDCDILPTDSLKNLYFDGINVNNHITPLEAAIFSNIKNSYNKDKIDFLIEDGFDQINISPKNNKLLDYVLNQNKEKQSVADFYKNLSTKIDYLIDLMGVEILLMLDKNQDGKYSISYLKENIENMSIYSNYNFVAFMISEKLQSSSLYQEYVEYLFQSHLEKLLSYDSFLKEEVLEIMPLFNADISKKLLTKIVDIYYNPDIYEKVKAILEKNILNSSLQSTEKQNNFKFKI